jgi:hypothetical protein
MTSDPSLHSDEFAEPPKVNLSAMSNNQSMQVHNFTAVFGCRCIRLYADLKATFVK